MTSLGYNLSSDDASASLNQTGDQNSTNPQLNPLADNGGPTFTHSLLPYSPAVDRGKNFTAATTDQRGPGFVRTFAFTNPPIPDRTGDGTDIGAFEVQAQPQPPTPTPTPTPTPEATNLALTATTGTYGGMVTLSATLISNSSPVSGKMITFTLNGNPAGTGVTDGTGVATVTNVSLSGINAGTYPLGVAASFAGDGGYSGSTGTAGLTVNARSLLITAQDQSKTYGATFTFAGTEFTLGAQGLAAGDSVTSVTLSTAGAAASAPAGTYPISPSAAVGSGLSNYAITYADGTFKVNRSPTSIAYTGFTTGTYLGTYLASAMVSSPTVPPVGTSVHFSLQPFGGGLELQGCTGTIDASGSASCPLQLLQPAGNYSLVATALGNDNFAPSSTSVTIIIQGATPTPTATPPPSPTPTSTPAYAAQIQQPINADGSSVFNVRRGVVPVKFTLTLNGVATCNLPPATIAVYRTGTGGNQQIDESVYTGPADNGSNFRIDSCQYVYNLSASALGVGTYEVDVLINNQVVGRAFFALR